MSLPNFFLKEHKTPVLENFNVARKAVQALGCTPIKTLCHEKRKAVLQGKLVPLRMYYPEKMQEYVLFPEDGDYIDLVSSLQKLKTTGSPKYYDALFWFSTFYLNYTLERSWSK